MLVQYMKRLCPILIFLLSSVILLCQNKQDYIWPLGLEAAVGDGILLDFNKKPVDISKRMGILGMARGVATIADRNGMLLFYTNGWAVANKEHHVMPNGLGLNDGRYFQEFWRGNWDFGILARQDMIILPDPSDSLGYYIIHKPFEYNPDQDDKPKFTMETMKYSYVDMRLDGGLGDVTKKDSTFFEGQFQSDYLSALANEDNTGWWFMTPARYDSLYYTWLLDEQGISLVDSQAIGPIAHLESFGFAGDARFSPDGSKYAYFNLIDGLSLFDFDRQTGELSHLRRMEWAPTDEYNWASTIEFSPNSRFIYIGNEKELFQLDTWTENLSDGLMLIHEWGELPELSESFFSLGLGPDCKIYCRSGNGSYFFHTIHSPDKLGLACDFIANDVILPNISSGAAFPNVPRFRVDEAEKCDSSITMVNGVNVFWRRDLEVYPSPASEYVTVTLPEGKKGSVNIIDMQGQVVWHEDNLTGTPQVDVSNLPAGLYSVEFVPERNEERVIYTQKVSVVH